MGLDMYAYRTATPISDVNFTEPPDSTGIAYRRKHPNLHGWMEALYREKGGSQENFNHFPVRLTLQPLERLQAAVEEDSLPETDGFFFGESEPEHKAEDLDFIQETREAIAEGDSVFYLSPWDVLRPSTTTFCLCRSSPATSRGSSVL